MKNIESLDKMYKRLKLEKRIMDTPFTFDDFKLILIKNWWGCTLGIEINEDRPFLYVDKKVHGIKGAFETLTEALNYLFDCSEHLVLKKRITYLNKK
jgi:hypothetical protein